MLCARFNIFLLAVEETRPRDSASVPAWDELFLRQRTNGTECSLVAGVEVQVSGANLYKRTVITCCSHDNKAAHMIGDHVHRLVHHSAGWKM